LGSVPAKGMVSLQSPSAAQLHTSLHVDLAYKLILKCTETKLLEFASQRNAKTQKTIKQHQYFRAGPKRRNQNRKQQNNNNIAISQKHDINPENDLAVKQKDDL
jgi:hypothetical protein